jgi:hypothetical protein
MMTAENLTCELSGNFAGISVQYFHFTYTWAMNLSEVLFLALTAVGVWFWLDSLKTREIGVNAARSACQDDGLQFLDETVVGTSVRLARDDAGRLRLRRVYSFEYSDTGNDRRSGSVTLLGHDVEFLHVRPHLYVIPNTHETLH